MVLLNWEALPRLPLQKYIHLNQDVTAIAIDTPGALTKLCQVFAKNDINLTYLRTHCQTLKPN